MPSIQTFPSTDSQDEQQANEWIKLALRIGVSSALHPFDFAKTLIQIGFEPLAPRHGSTLFGRPALVYPNLFQYVGYIKSVDGWRGCYRGLNSKLVGTVLSLHFSEKLADKMGVERVDTTEAELIYDDQRIFEKQLKRDVVVHSIGIIISQPFHVITIRTMAQFVGRETKYDSVFGSIVQIYKDDGIMGFFSGLFPRLLCDISCVVVASTATYFFSKKYLADKEKDKESRHYFGSFSAFVVSSIFYPLQVVATCMAVSGSGLRAGTPPLMPIFSSWRQCYNILKSNGQHKRGSSLFFRYVRPNQLKASNNF